MLCALSGCCSRSKYVALCRNRSAVKLRTRPGTRPGGLWESSRSLSGAGGYLTAPGAHDALYGAPTSKFERARGAAGRIEPPPVLMLAVPFSWGWPMFDIRRRAFITFLGGVA